MNEPIRVLHIVTTMNRGGLETMLMNYYRNIDRTKVQFDFVEHRSEKSAYDDEIESLGGKIYRVSKLVPWSHSYKNELKKIFIEHPEYKIVHVHQDCLSSVALKVAKECRVKVRIAHSHNADQDKNIKYIIKKIYKKKIPENATALFACGKKAGDWMFSGADYTILNNAIPSKEYIYSERDREVFRRELDLDGKYVVGNVGRFSLQKNHKFLLNIFSEVSKREADACLLLVGDGSLRSKIEDQIKKLDIQGKIILTGVRSDVPQLLQAMDVVVMPSRYEGLSLSCIEAQAAGLPLIVSDQVSDECMITDLASQVSLEADVNEWVERIIEYKNFNRKNTYKEILEAGFDIQINAEWLQKFYLSKVE